MHAFEKSIDEMWPRARWRDTRVLVAVSGGADSVALLCALTQLAAASPGGLEDRLHVAHFNHGWRGSESDADEAFVVELCLRLCVPYVAGRSGEAWGLFEPAAAPESAASNEISQASLSAKSEANARRERYDFLTHAAYQCGARYVLTAHTASDRVETLLHNLFRGTGLSGVVGPAAYRALGPELVLVRPLLACWREEIEEYLRVLGQGYRVDSSNANTTFQRNYLRRELLPGLRSRYGAQVDERLLAFSEFADEAVNGLQELANDYLQQVESLQKERGVAQHSRNLKHRSSIYLPGRSQLARPWPVVHRALLSMWQAQGWPLQAMSRGHWQKLREMCEDSRIGNVNLPGGLIARYEDAWLVIARSKGNLNIPEV